ncbi:MAG TPA: hypothetical protein VNO70_02465, partial [Blastocatellia bacterium]|nr:hypothetical protein [Blastocatellia bacterium]
PDCGDIVYFFSCSCGSRVFFDLAEPPWNPHEDRCVPYLIRFLREVERMSPASIRRLVEAYARKRGLVVPPDVRRRLLIDENRETGRTTVLEVLPNGSKITTLGTIVE